MIVWPLRVAAVSKFMKESDRTLTMLLIGIAVFLVLVALFVHNPCIKAIVLAWVVLP